MSDVADPASILSGYATIPGAYDEVVDASGHVRAHWRSLVSAFAALGRDEISRRAEGAARRLREAGVYYRVYDRNLAQPFPLSATPVVIDAADWRGIEAGLIQRAELLERALADFYGPQHLISNDGVPAAIIAGSPEFLRPMVGSRPRGGRYLTFYAADLGRGPDGRWWVLSDRTQAPSGAGYALGNRIALSRTLPETMRDLEVHRLADFFQATRTALSADAAPDSAGVCLLTPGPFNETYYEHVYLARYLGFHLVEGEDLVVRNGQVYLRTVAGFKNVDVLLRRLDADFADPLTLNPNSHLGAPGLAEAAREGHVRFANALGAGLIETRALMAFWPKLAQRVLGQDLLIPNIATWWCGDDAARGNVVNRLEDLAIAPAFTSDRLGAFREGAISGGALSPDERTQMIARLERRGIDFVGQEQVRLSTTPVWAKDKFEARPFQLRVFVVATENGWRVMPGGFARVSSRADPRAISMQRGGLSADAWVLADAPVTLRSLLPTADDVEIQRAAGVLTTRTADNMFWLGRYIERADASLRLVRAIAARTATSDVEVVDANHRMIGLMEAWGAIAATEDNDRGVAEALAEALGRGDAFGAPPVLVRRALNAGSAIRDALSPDAWRTINDLDQLLSAPLSAGSDELDRAERALRELAAFSGYAQENMTRGAGWVILDLGRRIERGLATSRFFGAMAINAPSPASLEALLELADSQITYARRYFVTASAAAVADLLIFDEDNPRACAFQAARLRELAERLPESAYGDASAAFRRSVVLLEATLASQDPRRVDIGFMIKLDNAFLHVADVFAQLYLADHDRISP